MRDKDLFIPIQRTRSVEWYSNLKSGASLTRPETAQDSLLGNVVHNSGAITKIVLILDQEEEQFRTEAPLVFL